MSKKPKTNVPDYTFKLVSDPSGKPKIFEENQENITCNRQNEVGWEDMFSYVPEGTSQCNQEESAAVYERLIKAGEYYK